MYDSGRTGWDPNCTEHGIREQATRTVTINPGLPTEAEIEVEERVSDAEEILAGLKFRNGETLMFEPDTWYEALAVLLAERSPA
jgi:hypothetical protein